MPFPNPHDNPPTLPSPFSGPDAGASLKGFERILRHAVVDDALHRYRPWRKVRLIARDAQIDPHQAWLAVKLRRPTAPLPGSLHQADGSPFVWSLTPELVARLHRIDFSTGGGGPASLSEGTGVLADGLIRDRIAIRSLMDEAIESSIIEGAATTRQLARQLLRSGRSARTRHELMVTNNYAAMRWIKGRLHENLSVPMLCELQRVLTQGTFERDPSQAGRLRRPDEPIDVVDRDGNQVYVPPPAEQLATRLEAVCRFANTVGEGDLFVHPMIRACILHFMVGYEHPFADGNGRTARAVFYWSALRAGYRVMEFTAVSELIRKSAASYGRAYQDVETDGGDLTYFLLYKLGVVGRAIDQVHLHLRREEERVHRSLQLTAAAPGLNIRQRLLLEHLVRHPGRVVTAKTLAGTYGVTTMTGRSDLEGLLERGLLSFHKVGKQRHYTLDPGAMHRLSAPNHSDGS